MPKYDYQCDTCKTVETRFVHLDNYDMVDMQACHRCHSRLQRLPHYGSLQIVTPPDFCKVTLSQIAPDRPPNDEVKKTWDECCVGKARWL